MKFGAPSPSEVIEWNLVFSTGWTLDYIRSLPLQDVYDYLQIKDARIKAGMA